MLSSARTYRARTPAVESRCSPQGFMLSCAHTCHVHTPAIESPLFIARAANAEPPLLTARTHTVEFLLLTAYSRFILSNSFKSLNLVQVPIDVPVPKTVCGKYVPALSAGCSGADSEDTLVPPAPGHTPFAPHCITLLCRQARIQHRIVRTGRHSIACIPHMQSRLDVIHSVVVRFALCCVYLHLLLVFVPA